MQTHKYIYSAPLAENRQEHTNLCHCESVYVVDTCCMSACLRVYMACYKSITWDS